MRKTETFLTGIILIAVIVITGGAFWYHKDKTNRADNFNYPTTKYGAFLAAQHAVYVNDFEKAAEFSKTLEDVDYPAVQSTKMLAEFLSGELPKNVESLKDEKASASRLIYDAYLLTQDNWKELYSRHKKDESALASPLKIWASVATNREKEALKFIDGLPTNNSWKDFVRGQIYAELNQPEKAAEYFAKVSPDFMNINDYLYISSFYKHHNMTDAGNKLYSDFTARPGGMFMLDYKDIPDWSYFSGYKNALAFSLVQNVSHTQIMMYSDLSILLLRFAQIIGPSFTENSDEINYYLGQYFYNNNGNYEQHFNKIQKDSPFYLFATIRLADKSGNLEKLEEAFAENPLFIPAVNKLVAHHTKNGSKRAALRVVNTALDNEKLNDAGRAFLLKSRALIYYTFGDFDKAQSDLHDASKGIPLDTDVLSLQAKIWAAQNREIENAYDYAMLLVTKNPTDINAWDTLGRVVYVREGLQPALDVLVRVGELSVTCSSLFEQLGDLYTESGDIKLAKDAYLRAIELSDDGLVIIPEIQKKLRKIK